MPSTSSTEYWQNARDALTGLVLDFARAKFIDTETALDDRGNGKDRAQQYYGNGAAGAVASAASSVLPLVLIGVAVLVGVLIVRKVTR